MFKLIVLIAVVLVAVNAAEYKKESYGDHKEAVSYQNYNLKNSKHVVNVKIPVVEKKEYKKEYEPVHYEKKYEPKYH